MTDQRVGRHIRIYEWDEVDVEADTLPAEPAVRSAKTPMTEKKAAPEQTKGLSALLKKKLF